MKKNLLVVSIILLMHFVAQAQATWEWLNPKPNGLSFTTCAISKTGKTYITRSDGKVFETNLSNTSFKEVNIGLDKPIQSYTFVNDNLEYAITQEGKLYKTINHGSNWTNVDIGISSPVYSIWFFNKDIAFIYGYEGEMLKSIDGGNTWTHITRNFGGFSITAPDDTIFDECGENWPVSKEDRLGYNFKFFSFSDSTFVTKTNDGSISFDTIGVIPQPYIEGFRFTDSLKGYAYGYGAVYKTLDGGKTWQLIYNHQSVTYADLTDISFPSKNIGYVVGSNYNGSRNNIIKTIDAGKTWSTKMNGIEIGKNNFTVTHFINDNIGLIASSGTMYRTINGGDLWTKVIDTDTLNITGMAFKDYLNGIAISQGYTKSYLLITADGGQSWVSKSASSFESIQWNGNSYKLLTLDYRIKETVDGTSFKEVFNNSYRTIYQLSYLGIDTAYIWCYDTVKITHDNWKTFTSYPVSFIRGKEFKSSLYINDNIWVFTDGGHIHKTINLGKDFTTYDIQGIWWITKLYIKNDIAFAIGAGGQILKLDSLTAVSITKLNKSNLSVSVYPNPVKDILQVKVQGLVSNENILLTVYDGMGKKIISMNSTVNTIQVNTKQLTSGIYNIKISTDNETVVNKFIKE